MRARTTTAALILLATILVAGGRASAQIGVSSSEFRGTVVDDDTGLPVQGFQFQIGDEQSRRGPGGSIWSEPRPSMSREPGELLFRLRTNEGRRIWFRVVADGYLPEPVFPELLTLPATHTDLKIRMKRGKPLRGRVLDHAGAAVVGAKVFLVRPDQTLDLTEAGAQRFAGNTAVAAEEGRFALAGGGAGGERIVVQTPGWLVHAFPWTQGADEMTLRLPAPAGLTIKCDFPIEAKELRFRAELKSEDSPQWKGVSVIYQFNVPNGGQVTLPDLTPGDYEVARWKRAAAGDSWLEKALDPRIVALKSGENPPQSFARTTGQPIRVDVLGLDALGTFGMIEVRRGQTDDRRAIGSLPIADVLATEANGIIQTEPLEPGDYQLFGIGLRKGYTGMSDVHVKVTIPKEGVLEPVQLDFKSRR